MTAFLAIEFLILMLYFFGKAGMDYRHWSNLKKSLQKSDQDSTAPS